MPNRLAQETSPYLLQHADNPVDWYPWGEEAFAKAKAEDKPVLLSVGYAACHWCHVMAHESFEDEETAALMNDLFVNIKVDREERPDVDQIYMSAVVAMTGQGGWPMTVAMTPDGKPFFGGTYYPKTARYGMPSFEQVLVNLRQAWDNQRDKVDESAEGIASHISRGLVLTGQEGVLDKGLLNTAVQQMGARFDKQWGGFSDAPKFPQPMNLEFMLRAAVGTADPDVMHMLTQTLDKMARGGMYDQIGGGFARYSVDAKWLVPHFEKMLYDQAMALWTYSVAHRVTGGERYRIMAEKIVRCLDDTFTIDGMYASAFNADTDHKEGATYLWSMKELAALLSAEEMERFREVYDVSDTGNFEGLNHLVRKSDRRIDDIEEKLLKARRQRSQPSRDDKILLGLNALTAVALIQAGRQLDRPELAAAAAGLTWRLLETFWDGSSLAHSYYDGVLQQQSYLSDAAAMLLAITMLYEDDHSWGEMMNAMADYVRRFHGSDGRWIESDAGDFMKIYASWFDHPVPSAVSLAETALTRVALLTGADLTPAIYRRPYQSDFYNINVLLTEDLFYLYTTRDPLPWSSIPVNSLQRRGEPETVCYDKVCRTAGLQDRTTERSGSPY
ncbi:MAG: thioredoxin domain-containing protein [Bacteroidales bacterium]|nr:thioredoxin domain-containing protein [Bacteroidales bacterium]